MNGEYSLADSQREAINHFNALREGDILAVSGPPGAGKTTLLQTVVADLYVKNALKQERPPIIIATSTNNQAVTNIINSFGKIDGIGISNIEKRWIYGVKSFALYFPSNSKEKEENNKDYHVTDCKWGKFASEIENLELIEKSKEYFLNECSKYFNRNIESIEDCKNTIFLELNSVENLKNIAINELDKIQKIVGNKV